MGAIKRYAARHPGSGVLGVAFFDLCRQALKLLFKVVYRAKHEGLANIPDRGPVLLVANHQSFFDPPFIGCWVGRRQIDFLARGGLFGFKPFGWLIETLHAMPIRQGSGDSGAMKEVLRRLGEGRAMLIFPEGSRTPDGEMQVFQRGIAVVLKRAQCDIVPVGISGVYDAWPRHKRLPRLFSKPIRVVYGQPISSEALMEDGADAALATLEKRIGELAGRAAAL